MEPGLIYILLIVAMLAALVYFCPIALLSVAVLAVWKLAKLK